MGITYVQPSKLGGIWDDITSAYNGVKTNLTDVVIPYWSDATKAAISATVTKISDLTGWLSDADNNIAQANVILNSIPANQVTAQDKSMAANIAAQQTSLVKKMNGISTDIQNGNQSGTDYQVQVSSNPADQSSGTFNVTTSLLPSGTSGLGILPLIVAGIAGVAITGTVVYEIYKLKNDSDQYLSYMQARAAAIKNGTPLPPLPPALAQYTTSSWSTWLVIGIGLAGLGYVVIKHYSTIRGLIHRNPYSTEHYKHIDIEPVSHLKPDTIRTIKRGQYRFIIGKPKRQFMGHTGYHGGATRVIAELVPISNPKEKSSLRKVI